MGATMKTIAIPAPETVETTSAVNLLRRQIIRVLPNANTNLEGGLYRVVWLARGSDLAFLLKLPTRSLSGDVTDVARPGPRRKMRLNAPIAFPLDTLTELLQEKRCLLTDAHLPLRFGRPIDDLSAFEKQVLARSLEIVSDFRNDKDLWRIFEHGWMGRYVAHTCLRLNETRTEGEERLSRDHVYQTVYRFWMYGWNDIALIGDSRNCGNPGKFRNPGNRNRGRPPKAVKTGHLTDEKNRNVDADMRKIMWVAWEAHSGKLGKYAAVYRRMVAECFCTDWKENERGDYEPGHVADNIPSLPVFRHYIRRRYDPVEILRHIIPVHTWNQTCKALRGKDFEHCFGPAQKFLIDATVADIYLVSTINRHWLIGRPIVYLVRDAWSGMIVGLHVALEGPSWATAAIALYNAFSPKGEFLQRYGFHMKDEDWPAAHGCMDLYHDRGEMLSIPSSAAALRLGINLTACAAFAPEQKGSIETLFHWQNKAVVHWLPGAVRARWKERGSRDFRLDAVLTLHQFTRIMIKAILHFNAHQDVRDRLVGSLAGLPIDPKPINLWNWGLRHLNSAPIRWCQDELIDAFLPTRPASLRADGVICGDRRFLGSGEAFRQGQVHARAFGTKKLASRFDPNRPEILYLPASDGTHYESIDLANPDVMSDEARDEEWIDYQAYLNLEATERGDSRKALVDHVSLEELARQEVKKGRRLKKQVEAPASKAARTSGIRENRMMENALLARQPFLTSPETAPPLPDIRKHAGAADVPADVMSLLLANRK